MVAAVTGALETTGMKVEVVARGETFARLLVMVRAGATNRKGWNWPLTGAHATR